MVLSSSGQGFLAPSFFIFFFQLRERDVVILGLLLALVTR